MNRRLRIPHLLLFVSLLAAAISVPALADFTASGTFQYEDRPFDLDGFTGEQAWLPIRRADVEVVDLLTQTVLGSGQTDDSGAFQLDVALTVARTIYVRCLTDTAADPLIYLQVKDDAVGGAIYAVAGSPVPNHDPWSDLDCGTLTAVAGAGGEAFNIFDAALKSLDYFHHLSGSYPGPAWSLALFWRGDAGESSNWYDDVYRQVILSDNAGYDDSVILHETGHYIQSAFALCQSPGGSHYITDMNQDRRLAFSEGWATYYGSAVRRHHQESGAQAFVRTTGGSGAGNLDFSFELEGPSMPVFGSFNELAVGACLWDLMDQAHLEGENFLLDDDPLSGKGQRVWAVTSEVLPETGEATMEAFWNGWLASGQEQPAGVESIFSSLGMEYVVDTWEPEDDRLTGAIDLVVVDPQPQPLVVINEVSLGAVDWLELYNGGGAAVDLTGWTVRAGRSGGSVAEFDLPAFTLYPHHYLALFEGSGEDGVDRIFFSGTNIPWITNGDGYCALLDVTGTGVDFCRWGGGSEPPPEGTTWAGPDPAFPFAGMNLGRDSAGSDTDLGGDFGPVAPTAAGPNWEPGGGLNHHSFYPAADLDWLSIQALTGQRYDLEVFNRCSGAEANLTLYAPDGVTALFSEGCDGSFGSGPRRAWVAPADGEYLLSLVNDGQQGDYGSYDLQATVIPVIAPSAVSLSPALLGVDASVPITLTGDGFLPGLTAWFSSPEITCRQVDVVDRSTAVLLVSASPAAAPGFHDLMLRGPDGAEALLAGGLQVVSGRGAVVINEMNFLENWIELRNIGGDALNLTGWEIRVMAGGNAVTGVFPEAAIAPDGFLMIYDLTTPGENGPDELHLDLSFGWGLGIYGSCALVDTELLGRDFVRWDGVTGSSLDSPPSGTGWNGPNPINNTGFYALGRDQGSSDTESGFDFSGQEQSPGAVNTAPAPLVAILSGVERPWVGEELSVQLQATGGEPPYRWFLSGGLPPPGLSITEAGLIQGVPTVVGSWTLELSVVDAVGRRDTGELILVAQTGLSADLASQPAVATFPCTVVLEVDLGNFRTGEAVVAAELIATGSPPEGFATYTVADSTVVLPPGQVTHFDLTYQIPDSPQFASGVIFRLSLSDIVTDIPLVEAQCEVRNKQQLQHQQGGRE